MNFALSDEQLMLQEAARQALARHATLEAARGALDGEAPPSLWPTAVEAGWTGLLIGEEADGAGLGALEALLVLEACGRRLADARLLGHLPATALIDAAGGDDALRGALAAGERRAALVDGLAGRRSGAVVAAQTVADAGQASGTLVLAQGEADAPRLTGAVDDVLDAPGADVLVVLARDATGTPVAALVQADGSGVSIESQPSYDGSRSVARVRLEGATGRPLAIPAGRVADAEHLQRALLGAEALGAADACLTMARDYATDRVAFGRPIGSYQAIKHKLVEMLRRAENARSLSYYAGWAWASRREDFALAANALRVAAGDALDYAAPETIFIHGGTGATWEHDASLYYRRAEVSRRLAGGTDAAADTVARELLAAHAA